MKQSLLAGMAALVCVGCLGDRTEVTPEPTPGMSEAEQAAYQACLQRNMAVAVAWSVIEENCAREARGEKDPLAGR